MRAWIKRDGRLQLDDVPTPAPASGELLVQVKACSLNRGEVRAAARAADGVIPGWDVAGIVASGPRAGTRVAALVPSGAWAESIVVPSSRAAVVPDDVSLEVASTLPIAALTVVRALDVAGSLVGKSALITGASGGVGQFATQLAALAGAHVTAVRAATDTEGSHDFILESVGGPSLAAAIDRLARGGVLVTIGNSSDQDTTFNTRTFFLKGAATIYGLIIFEEVESGRVGARDLERLFALIQTGRLHAPVEVTRPWTELPALLEELEQRKFAGKAVVTIG